MAPPGVTVPSTDGEGIMPESSNFDFLDPEFAQTCDIIGFEGIHNFEVKAPTPDGTLLLQYTRHLNPEGADVLVQVRAGFETDILLADDGWDSPCVFTVHHFPQDDADVEFFRRLSRRVNESSRGVVAERRRVMNAVQSIRVG